ncbi:response regulator transcription factor [Streptomyces sp. NPDC048845]|uniref:response regulator transcription factor n=1 Tax=Streptomyces sp. NPDC048845 TaxID=3155390 RepID=UPI0034162BA0
MVIRVVVADDQAVVRTGFVNLLSTQEDIEVVGEAESGREAVHLVRKTQPDVALLDIRMPVMDGVEAARQISSAGDGTTRVLMFTTFGLDEYVYDSLAAGASGFLLKDATFPELLHAVRVIARGEALLAPAVTKRLIAEFAKTRRPAVRTGPIGDLTPREIDVLVQIARGLSNTEIREALSITDHTVKTHVNRIFAKLGLRDRAQAVIAAYEAGLVTAENA